MKKGWVFIAMVALISLGCERKPTACLELDETLESGDFITLVSCSENYGFQTWEFSDGVGTVGDSAQRTFDYEGDVTVRLTAYSDGAYRSDVAEQTCKLSYRYIDRFEITGAYPYDSLSVEFGLDGRYVANGTDSTFAEDAPLILYVWPNSQQVIEPTQSSITLTGLVGATRVRLASQKFNFDSFKENPAEFTSSNGRFNVKMFWRFKD